MGDLRPYRSKRDPDATPEPLGEEKDPRVLPAGARKCFVVQQHAARRLHWDLRLEIDGVLASWAVPRGPSLDPGERRLAVRTEDHPLEYADFEGVIPEGNYGAGAMIVWDRGTYVGVGGEVGRAGLEAGKLDLRLRGHKLSGRFALVRTRHEGERDWLLIRKGPPLEGEDVVEARPASVLSGLTVEELAEGVTRDTELRRRLRGAPTAELDAAELRPMLAERAEAPFSRAGWLFELKYDGVRLLVEKREGRVRVFTRRGIERSDVYPELAAAAGHLPVEDFILDGEVVALDERGRPSFELLQRRFTQTDPRTVARLCHEIPTVFYAFDLLGVCGRDVRGLPLTRRKALLARFVPEVGVVRHADAVEKEGEALFELAREHELEGIVAKRADSAYETGRRSSRWVKVKVPRRVWLAVVGIAAGKGSRAALGSLLLAWRRGDELVYAGNVGSGLDDATIEALLADRDALRAEAPFVENPPEATSGITWLRPERACRVAYTEVTSAGLLRHPVFLGLARAEETELSAAPGAHEEPPPSPSEPPADSGPGLEITRPEKVFWPAEGYTKGDLLGWYEGVWPWLGPYLRDRPVVLTRYPDGIEGKHFFQRNAPDFTPAWARTERIDGTDYFVCNDLETLLYVVNSGAIPLHVWSARVDDLEHPDWLILDLDRKEAPFSDVVAVARHVHHLLGELETAHFVKTSGQDGLHVMLPLGGLLDHDEARTLAEVIARVLCAELPAIATITRPIAARGDKVYVDYLQNGRGKLIAAPFSVRPRAGAPVSMPLTWAQVGARLVPARWTIKTAMRRLRSRGDPLAGVLADPIDVEGLLEALSERLSG